MERLRRHIAIGMGLVTVLILLAGWALAMEGEPARRAEGLMGTEAGELALPSLTVAPGSRVTVTLGLAGVGENVYSADVVLHYNASVVNALAVSQGSLVSTWSVVSNLATPGEIRIALAGAEPVSEDGEMASIVFEVVGSEGTSTDLAIAHGNLNEGAVSVTLRNGRISVGTSTCYDFDDSGMVDEADVVLTVSHWRERAADAGWEARFDANMDGVIDVLDILLVAQEMGGTCP